MANPSELGATIRVFDSFGLATALQSARPGDVIRLAPSAERYTLDHRGAGASGIDLQDVIITSDDPANPARFSAVGINKTSDLTFRDVVFETRGSDGDKTAFDLANAARITVEGSLFEGPATAWLSKTGPYSGKAVTLRNVEGFTFSDNRIENFSYGLQITNTDAVTIIDNEITGIQVDGVQVSDSVGLRFAENLMWDFWGVAVSRAHADFIQFWTKNATRRTENIVIEDNLMWASGNAPAQLVFVNNEKMHSFGADAAHFQYRDVTISGNLLINDNPNTIFVHGADSVLISDNALFNKIDPADRRSGNEPWIRVLDHVDNALVEGNLTPRIRIAGGADVERRDNTIMTYADPTSPNYYQQHLQSLARWAEEPLYHEILAAAGLSPATLSEPSGAEPSGDAQAGSEQPPANAAALALEDTLLIDASDYDTGPAGVAYGDAQGLQGGTNGGRADGDVEHTSGGDIGWIEDGDWLAYTIDVAAPADFAVALTLATANAGRSVAVSFHRDGAAQPYAMLDPIATRDTGGFNRFETQAAGSVSLEAGQQTMRVSFAGGDQDFRAVELTRTAPSAQPAWERIGDAGTIVVEQAGASAWTTVRFAEAMENPIVVLGPPSDNGSDPTTTRVRNITETGFELQIDEWDYLDGRHIAETISWMAVEAGVHQLRDGTIVEAGATVGGAATVTQDLAAAMVAAPVVFGQIASAGEDQALAPRISAVDADSFDFRLQEQEAGDGRIGATRFDWIAVSTGASGLLAAGRSGATLTHDGLQVGAASAPEGGVDGFFAALQTFNGPDTAGLRMSGLDGARARLFIEEETSADPETDHVGEAVGWLALGPDAFLV